jgi:nicotinamidase-related amidase
MYLDANRTAVLALHMQGDIVAPGGALADFFAAEVERTGVIPAVGRVLDAARTMGAKVIYARVAYQPGYPDLIANSPLTQLTVARQCLLDGTPGTAIVAELVPHSTDLVLSQQRVSAFQSTQLDPLLRAAGVDTLVLCGVATNITVDSTARAASDLGYRTLIVGDACAADSAESHDAALRSLGLLAEITTIDDLIDARAPAAIGAKFD